MYLWFYHYNYSTNLTSAHLVPARVLNILTITTTTHICTIFQNKLNHLLTDLRVVCAIVAHGVRPLLLHQRSCEIGLHLASNVRYL